MQFFAQYVINRIRRSFGRIGSANSNARHAAQHHRSEEYDIVAVSVKVVRSGKEVMVAACDSELLGNTLTRGNTRFHVHPSFYGGRLVSVEEAISEAKSGTSVNLVGERIVDQAIEKGLVHPEAVIYLSGVPYALIVKI